METKHTKQDWKFKTKKGIPVTIENGKRVICEFDTTGNYPYVANVDESLANAKLIAAAPDLLEALQKILMINSGKMSGDKADIYKIGNGAIKKATS